AARHRRASRRGREGDAEWARRSVEAAAAARASSQRGKPFAVRLTFVAHDSRHIFGAGGDPPKFLAAATSLAMGTLRKGQGPDRRLLEILRRDRERRATFALDRVVTVVSPGGLLSMVSTAHTLIRASQCPTEVHTSQNGASAG
ncbi:unnamed protein product, partial [Choristocarpus tenellus]